MKLKYEFPEIEIVLFEKDEVVLTYSNGGGEEWTPDII